MVSELLLGSRLTTEAAYVVGRVAGLALFAQWLRESDRRVRGHDEHWPMIVIDPSVNAPAQEAT